MSKNTMKVVTESIYFYSTYIGWQVRIIEVNWDGGPKVGWTLESEHLASIFSDSGNRVFKSRRLARKGLREYKIAFPYVNITGGLH